MSSPLAQQLPHPPAQLKGDTAGQGQSGSQKLGKWLWEGQGTVCLDMKMHSTPYPTSLNIPKRLVWAGLRGVLPDPKGQSALQRARSGTTLHLPTVTRWLSGWGGRPGPDWAAQPLLTT